MKSGVGGTRSGVVAFDRGWPFASPIPVGWALWPDRGGPAIDPRLAPAEGGTVRTYEGTMLG